MSRDVYIGRKDDPRFLEVHEIYGNGVPVAVCGCFPNGFTAHWRLMAHADAGRLVRVGGDNGATVVNATRAQILEFLDEVYPKGIDKFKTSPHLGVEYEKIVKFVQEMEDDGQWVLVASEL